jgi:CheY-like chemotaxis protein
MQKRIIAACSDVFFAVKINAAVKQAGLELKLAGSHADAIEKARAKPALIIVDLNDRAIPALPLVQELKGDEELRGIPVLAFLSHVQAELEQQAWAAGIEAVVPRSVFSSKLPELIARLVPARSS